MIRELKKSNPKLVLQVELGDMTEMVELLHQNRIDLALGVSLELKEDFETRLVFKDELLFAFSPSHRWADGQSIAREDLRKQPLIVYQRSSATTRMIDDYFRQLQIVPSTVMEIGSIEAIKELVKLDLGISVLAPWTADKELARGKLAIRHLGARALSRQWVVAFLKGRRLNLVEETFCRLCRNFASGLRLDRKDIRKA